MARANVKTVELAGTEIEVTDLGGQNAAIKNLSSSTVWASAFPNVAAGADNVVEIPAGSGEVVLDARGTVYLLGTGKVQCTGTPYATLNFKLPSQSESGGGGGVENVTKSYVDAQDSTNLGAAKTYTDTAVNAVKEDISANTDSISALQNDVTAAQAVISINTGDINTLRADLTAAQTDIAANTAAAANNSKNISVLQADVAAATENIDNNLMTVNESISDLQNGKADKSELPTALPANGGNADTVNDHTVNADVPGDAKFTDTIVDISGKMDKTNPTGTGAFSMNRKIDSIVGANSFAEGFNTAATNDRAHAEGHTTQANGLQAHSEGYYTEANGHASHTEGNHTSTVNSNAHAEGANTCAGGKSSHAEGYNTYTDPAHDGAHAEGGYCTAEGQASHAQGWATYAVHNYSFAAGNRTKTGRVCDTVLGLLNLPNSNSLLTIGFGSGGNDDLVDQELTGKEYNDYAREGATLKNVFRVDTSGKVYGVGAFNTSGADYAEYIKPWFDDNTENEDRRGYFVTVKDGKLHKAEPGDYIVGITSGNPSVVGNGDEDWLGRWQRDEFNELVYQDVEVDDYGESEDENGSAVSVKIGSHIEKQTVQNPCYDPNQKYIERKDRPEWSYVGMIGVIPLRDDGTCAAGGFAKCGAGGIATAAAKWECHKTFFVIERINDHIISVEMR